MAFDLVDRQTDLRTLPVAKSLQRLNRNDKNAGNHKARPFHEGHMKLTKMYFFLIQNLIGFTRPLSIVFDTFCGCCILNYYIAGNCLFIFEQQILGCQVVRTNHAPNSLLKGTLATTFSSAKATLKSHMSVCLSICPFICHRNCSASQNPVYLLLSLHLDLEDDLSDLR